MSAPSVEDVVLDASVVVPWFAAADAGSSAALRRRYEEGDLAVAVPHLLFLEVLNIAARQLRWPTDRLAALASDLLDIGFQTAEPPLAGVAAWAARGLTAYDAAYVALAESLGIPLITADREIVRIAGPLARTPA